MRICVISRNLNEDYTGSFEFDQAMALKKAGQEVAVISLDLRSIRHKRKLGVYVKCFEGITVVTASFPLGAITTSVFNACGIVAFKKAYKTLLECFGRVDVVHTHFLENSYIVVKSLEKESVPVIVTEHSSRINRSLEDTDKKTKTLAEYTYTNADKLVTVSEALRKRIIDNYGIDSTVIFNVVDTSIFFRNEKHLMNKTYANRFICVGNLTTNKRQKLLVDCWATAFRNDTECTLTIIGDGPEKHILLDSIENLNMQDRILLLGKRSRREVADALYKADVFVLLSKSETFGVSYIEAMLAGLPVVCAKSGGPESFVNEDNGIVTGDSEVEVVEALREVRQNIKQYSRQKIREYAINICSPEVIAQRLNNVYKEVLKRE